MEPQVSRLMVKLLKNRLNYSIRFFKNYYGNKQKIWCTKES